MKNPYYYRPLAIYDGVVYKCAGMVSEENARWFPEYCAKAQDIYLPGFIVLDEYKGDKVISWGGNDLEEYDEGRLAAEEWDASCRAMNAAEARWVDNGCSNSYDPFYLDY